MKRQDTDWENVSATFVSGEGFVSQIYKENWWEKEKQPSRIISKNLNRQFTEEETQILYKHIPLLKQFLQICTKSHTQALLVRAKKSEYNLNVQQH